MLSSNFTDHIVFSSIIGMDLPPGISDAPGPVTDFQEAELLLTDSQEIQQVSLI